MHYLTAGMAKRTMKRGMGRRCTCNKRAVVSLVERGGRGRSQVVHKVTGDALRELLKQHVAETDRLNTDEPPLYKKSGKRFASHGEVRHGREKYARHDTSGRLARTSTAEGFFGNAKRTLKSTDFLVSVKQLPLHLAEPDYTYNTLEETNDASTTRGILKIVGKRLTQASGTQ